MNVFDRPRLWAIVAFAAIGAATGVYVSAAQAYSAYPYALYALPLVLLAGLLAAASPIRKEEATALVVVTTLVTPSSVNVSLSDIYVIALALLLFVKRESLEFPRIYLLLVSLYLSYAFLSLLWTNNDSKLLLQGVQFAEFFAVATVLLYNVRREEMLVRSVRLYVIGSTLLAVTAVAVGIATRQDEGLYMLGIHKNLLGAFLGNALPLVYGMSLIGCRPRLYAAVFVVHLFALLISASRGSMIGAIAALLVMQIMLRKWKHLLYIALAGGASFLLFVQGFAPRYWSRLTEFGSNSSAYSRVLIFNDAIAKIKENPWIGHGLGSYFIRLPQIGFEQDDPNNLILRTLVELGVVGLVLFAAVLLYIGAAAFGNNARGSATLRIVSAMAFGGFLSQLVHMQFDVSWVRGTGLFMFAMAGIVLAVRRTRQEELRLEAGGSGGRTG